MSYNKINFVNNETKLNASNMNHMDDGIYDNSTRLDDHDGRIHTLEREVGHMEEQDLDFDNIINNIRSGYGKDYYIVGDKLLINYNYSGTNYSTPHNIVDHSDATIFEEETEKTVPALWLEWHNTVPLGLAFDPDEIMMVVGPNGMPAGTYYFKVTGDSWASQNGKFIQFTVTNNLTAGQCLKPNSSYNTTMAGKNMVVYADGKSFTALYSFIMSEGQTGIYLGEMYSKTDQGQAATYLTLDTEHNVYINHYHRVFLGYNRWKDSLYRQWLNAVGLNWWVAQNIFDRAPSNIASLQGFLTGYDNDFTSRLKTVKRTTYKNVVTDDGSTDVTYDKVFLHTMAEINVDGFTSQQNTGGLEGKPWDFYKQLAVGQSNLNTNGTFKACETYPILIKYALNNQTSAQYVFTQSAYRSHGNFVLNVRASGYVYIDAAVYGNRCLPACVLC